MVELCSKSAYISYNHTGTFHCVYSITLLTCVHHIKFHSLVQNGYYSSVSDINGHGKQYIFQEYNLKYESPSGEYDKLEGRPIFPKAALSGMYNSMWPCQSSPS